MVYKEQEDGTSWSLFYQQIDLDFFFSKYLNLKSYEPNKLVPISVTGGVGKMALALPVLAPRSNHVALTRNPSTNVILKFLAETKKWKIKLGLMALLCTSA